MIVSSHIDKTGSSPARLVATPRVRVAQIVMDYHGRGWSVDEIVRQYPHLSKAEVHSALAYYYDHVDEIRGEITAELKELPVVGAR